MSQFTFSDQNIQNCDLLHESGRSLSYRIDTPYTGRKMTTLAPMGHGPSRGISGAIDWRKDTFRVGGVTRDRSTIKHKTGGIFSSTREWRWSRQTYTVKFNDGTWTASTSPSDQPTVATFFPFKFRFFSPSGLARITFTPGVLEEDMIFLILVMIWSDIRQKNPDQ